MRKNLLQKTPRSLDGAVVLKSLSESGCLGKSTAMMRKSWVNSLAGCISVEVDRYGQFLGVVLEAERKGYLVGSLEVYIKNCDNQVNSVCGLS